MGDFTLTSADYDKAAQSPAMIRKIEVKADDEDASQWQDLGRIKSGTGIMRFNNASDTAQGNMPQQLGYMVEIEAELLASSVNLAVAMSEVIDNATGLRLTDINSSVWTFNTTASDPDIDVTTDILVEGDGEQARRVKITAGGYLTKAKLATVYS